jgi:CRISPR-associated protein Csb1
MIDVFHVWTEDAPEAPVAITLRQKLVSVEGEDAVIFPPTYANIGYNIDTLADGTKVALIDSVGSQANRMEPIFKDEPYSELVPQITIMAGNHRPISIFEVGHRVADALVRSSRPISDMVTEAFDALAEGNAEPMAKLAPTSLVFGVWDSRGEGMKVPRLISSVIRAHDVSELRRSAQYMPPLMPDQYAELMKLSDKEKEELEEAQQKTDKPMAKAGFVPVPSVNDPGGIIAHGGVRRDATVNLVALRKLDGDNAPGLRRYILGLTLVAATWPQDGYLRQGCQLVAAEPATWQAVYRDGRREDIELSHDDALTFARQAMQEFGKGEDMQAEFESGLAREVLKKAKK